jgi:VanZ family protein
MHSDADISPNRFRQAAILARYGTLVLLAAMFVGTHIPSEVSDRVVHGDKMLHFWAYLTLAFAAATAWDFSTGKLQRYQYVLLWLACAVYGVADELLQIPVGRTCDAQDWAFDIAGAATGLALFKLLRPLVYRVALLVPAAARSKSV